MLTGQRCLHSVIKYLSFSQTIHQCPRVMSVLSNRRQFSVSPVPKVNLKNISVLSDLRCLPQGPGPALCLGVAGLIPFVTAPLYMANSGYFLPDIATAQLAYGASILSFLGGVRCVICIKFVLSPLTLMLSRWGMLVSGTGDDLPPSWAQFTWSVTPSLIAWTAVLVPSLIGGNVLCISGQRKQLSLE